MLAFVATMLTSVATPPTPATGSASPAPTAASTPTPRSSPAAPPAPGAPAEFDRVVMISVDGLHSGVLAAERIGSLPAFARLMRGPHTLEARTDPDATITLPNHVSMITSQPLLVHRWEWNDDPPAIRHGGTIHARAGRYIPSVFDVAHDRGLSTALFAGKTKFWLFEQSYGDSAGAKDATPPDNGRAKIDLVVYAERGGDLAAQCAARLHGAAAKGVRTLDMIHFAEPDSAGHAHEWDLAPGSKYMASVMQVDRWLGEFLAELDGDDRLRGRVAIVLTTDHGGGKPEKTHTDITAPCNFTIPFLVWLGADAAPSDLYALNQPTRRRPGADEHPPVDAEPPPIRNGDLGNTALQLLGLPAIPGSRFGARQHLRFVPPEAAPAAIPQARHRSADVPDWKEQGGPWTLLERETTVPMTNARPAPGSAPKPDPDRVNNATRGRSPLQVSLPSR